MGQSLLNIQEGILGSLAGELEGFYLAGGTALALYYFHHRVSEDLDFFTQQFNQTRVVKLIDKLSELLRKEIVLVAEQSRQDRARMLVYNLHWDRKMQIRLDFIEDVLKRIKPVKVVNQVPILSLEDIFLRKIFAMTGAFQMMDTAGRQQMIGGRQTAKDFYDLYYLSHTFMNLSEFAIQYCDATRQEGLVQWFRTYDRFRMKSDLLDLRTTKESDYREMERHFKREIDHLLERGLDSL